MAALRPLGAPATLREAVVGHLRTAILSGELAPGALLRETDLAARLGVSATPVREALGDLAADGLVEIQPNRLKRVSAIDGAEMRDLLRIQVELWKIGYGLCVDHVGPPELEQLAAAVTGIAAATAAGDRSATMDTIYAFHTTLIRASGSAELLRLTLNRRGLIARFVILRAGSLLDEMSVRYHRLMLQAVRRRDRAALLGVAGEMCDALFAYLATLPD